MRAPWSMFAIMLTNTQPSAPKPVASATSEPNSSNAQRRMTSGRAPSKHGDEDAVFGPESGS